MCVRMAEFYFYRDTQFQQQFCKNGTIRVQEQCKKMPPKDKAQSQREGDDSP